MKWINRRMANKIVSYMVMMLIWGMCVFAHSNPVNAAGISLSDGEYKMDVKLEGGTGKATVTSPALVTVKDGNVVGKIEWSSSNYDYMIVNGEKYLPVNEEGNSVFEIPVDTLNAPINVIADTTAMSTPHEVSYSLTFSYNIPSGKENLKASKSWVMPYGYVIVVTVFIVGLMAFLLYKKKSSVVAAILIIILFLTLGCSFYAIYQKEESVPDKNMEEDAEDSREADGIPETIGEHLIWTGSMELDYATGFFVDYYKDENDIIYKRINIEEDIFLVVPDIHEVYGDIPKDYVLLEQPKQIYLVASQVMDMMVALDVMDDIQFSGLDAKDWYIEEARNAIESGSLLYAGKYSAPDYELILDKGCDLTIENTMIYHTPEVKEKLESFKIPVIVDRSSYEPEPLGRMEWIKLYGALMNCEDKAKEVFEEQAKQYREIEKAEKGKDKPTVAFFYISANGDVIVRKSNDYMVKMIEAAGGEYVFSDLKGEEGSMSSTVNMQLEDFYAGAMDADYIIYNSTIEGELEDLKDLTKKSELLRNMKAVKEGNVYCTSNDLYQSSMELGTIVSDIHKMIEGESDMTYLYPLK